MKSPIAATQFKNPLEKRRAPRQLLQMKTLLALIACLASGSLGCLARDTAYQALRTLGKERGQEILNHVIQVEGHGGSPQPANWKVLVEDPAARSGVREFEISEGRIVSERTPVRNYAGSSQNAVMDFGKLNLDSSGAFSLAEKEASKSRIGFDNTDYLLRRDDIGATPTWVLRLMDSTRHNVATLFVAADTGTVTQRNGFGTKARVGDGDVAAAPLAPDVPPLQNKPDDDSGDQNENGVGHQIDKALHRAGASLQQFFTGKRTLDKRFQDEP